VIERLRRADVLAAARQWGIRLEPGEVEELGLLADELVATLRRLEGAPLPAGPTASARRGATKRPTPSDDPLNAIEWWCDVESLGAAGALGGLRVAAKSSIAVAGVPLTSGSKVLESFVPSRDSAVVQRILHDGGRIVASTTMDEFGFSAGGDSSAHGAVRNPFDDRRSAGGSSGGSAACLHYEAVDAALGCDQAGSIRAPAAWCGVLGLKPTYGLVPCDGIIGIDGSLDHCGPIARTVRELALLLRTIAGRAAPDYVAAVDEAASDLEGVSIGVVEEALDAAAEADTGVAAAMRDACARFADLGADVRPVSLPEHLLGGEISVGIFSEALAALLAWGGNVPSSQGADWPELAAALHEGLAVRAFELSPQVKLALVLGTHLRRTGGYYYARAQRLRAPLTRGYEVALARDGVLLLPTTPQRPHELREDMTLSARVRRGWAVLVNTSQTSMTGHPALTLPAAAVDGLPVGVMLVAPRHAEGTLLGIARTYERAYGWEPTGARPTHRATHEPVSGRPSRAGAKDPVRR
jgi:amidase